MESAANISALSLCDVAPSLYQWLLFQQMIFSAAKPMPGAYLCCYCCSATVISSLGLTVAFSPVEQRCKKDRCIDPQHIIRSCHTLTLKKLIVSNNLTQGSFYTSLGFYS